MNEQLRQHYENLPINKANSFRSEVIAKTGITYDIWWNWIKGRTEIPVVYNNIIKSLLK